MESLERRILDEVGENGPLHSRQLAKRLGEFNHQGLTTRQASHLLGNLWRLGKLTRRRIILVEGGNHKRTFLYELKNP